jgi:polysaccharide export outer membrane protein
MNDSASRRFGGRRTVLFSASNRRAHGARRHQYISIFVATAALICGCALQLRSQENKITGAARSSFSTLAVVRTDVGGMANAKLLENSSYRLCPSDSVMVTFSLTPEFNQTVDIQPDGYANLQGTNPIFLQGLTTQEAAVAVHTAYANILHQPLVTVELKDFKRPFFIVIGEVNKPGKYELRGYTSATEAVAVAGGFNNSAKQSQVLLFRRDDNEDWYGVTTVDLHRMLEGRNLNEDPEIRAGDMIFVAKNFASKIRRFIPFIPASASVWGNQ